MTTELFEQLVSRDESDTLDFKKEQYEFINDDNIAKFVKDILAFANTIRKDDAYIVIGIEQTPSGKTFHGLNKNIDDAIFQDKIKSKVYPIPKFSYSVFNYGGIEYGIIKIPLQKYSEILAPVVKMKGLEVGKIYIRRGSTNSEAYGKETIQIHNWIQNVESSIDIKKETETLIYEINAAQSILSACVSKALKIANSSNDKEFIRFCKGELMGWRNGIVELNNNNLPLYRITKAMISEYSINKVHVPKGTSINLIKELKQRDDFFEIDYFINDTLRQIEVTLKNSQRYFETTEKLGNIIPDSPFPNKNVYIYTQFETYQEIVEQAKIELIRHLFKSLE